MKSHYIFFEALMRGLAEDGNNVTFVGPFPPAKATVNFEQISTDLPIEMEEHISIV